jgi:hypothetical protein
MKFIIYLISLGSLVLVLLWSCKSTQKSIKNIPTTKENVCEPLLMSETKADTLRSDTFDLVQMSINGKYLNLVIGYDGGCGNSNMMLYYNSIDKSTIPAQLHLIPQFTDNDPCRAIESDTLQFDLHEFEGLARSGGIAISMNGFNKIVTYALPLH